MERKNNKRSEPITFVMAFEQDYFIESLATIIPLIQTGQHMPEDANEMVHTVFYITRCRGYGTVSPNELLGYLKGKYGEASLLGGGVSFMLMFADQMADCVYEGIQAYIEKDAHPLLSSEIKHRRGEKILQKLYRCVLWQKPADSTILMLGYLQVIESILEIARQKTFTTSSLN